LLVPDPAPFTDIHGLFISRIFKKKIGQRVFIPGMCFINFPSFAKTGRLNPPGNTRPKKDFSHDISGGFYSPGPDNPLSLINLS
jgi:hypothetical protein